jgi:hypothetical protein
MLPIVEGGRQFATPYFYVADFAASLTWINRNSRDEPSILFEPYRANMKSMILLCWLPKHAKFSIGRSACNDYLISKMLCDCSVRKLNGREAKEHSREKPV